MKKNKSKKKMNRIVKELLWLIVSCALLGGVWLLQNMGLDDVKIVNVIFMAAGVLVGRSALTMLLSFMTPINHRIKTMVTLFSSLINYIAFMVILCWGLTILGVNVGTIVTSVGILALVVGFGAESLIADIITGMFMIFENQYNVGDIIEVNGFRGEVSHIGIRATTIVDSGMNIKIINNSEMKNVINRSDRSSVAVSDIFVSYSTDLEELEKKLPMILASIYNANMNVMKEMPKYLGVQSFTKDSVILRFIADVEEDQVYNATRILNRELYIKFKNENVKMPI